MNSLISTWSIEEILMYMRSKLNSNMKLKNDQIIIDIPQEFKEKLIENREEVKNTLLAWRKTYIDQLKKLQERMNDDLSAKESGFSDTWDDSAEILTKNFIYIEEFLHDNYDYGDSCINGNRGCKDEVMSCHYCTNEDFKGVIQ